jgi:hypothetical protein
MFLPHQNWYNNSTVATHALTQSAAPLPVCTAGRTVRGAPARSQRNFRLVAMFGRFQCSTLLVYLKCIARCLHTYRSCASCVVAAQVAVSHKQGALLASIMPWITSWVYKRLRLAPSLQGWLNISTSTASGQLPLPSSQKPGCSCLGPQSATLLPPSPMAHTAVYVRPNLQKPQACTRTAAPGFLAMQAAQLRQLRRAVYMLHSAGAAPLLWWCHLCWRHTAARYEDASTSPPPLQTHPSILQHQTHRLQKLHIVLHWQACRYSSSRGGCTQAAPPRWACGFDVSWAHQGAAGGYHPHADREPTLPSTAVLHTSGHSESRPHDTLSSPLADDAMSR